MTSLGAIVLCGGKGMRLRPLTEDLPKPLVPIRGRPIIDYIVDHLTASGITNITLAGGYRVDKLSSHFKDSNVQVVDTGDCDIARRIEKVDYGADEYLILYGDTLSNVDLTALEAHHRHNNRLATVTVWPMTSPFGLFEIENQRALSYVEKPTLAFWINIGYFILTRGALQTLASSRSFEDFIASLVNEQQLGTYQHHGLHVTVNTRAELDDAETALEDWGL
ncbi:MAG: nucleotidyltransferase family protein [Micrococcales bacterium]|nr:nucleotidyltransferase family protein [Micrococcales bacterium]